MAHDVFISYSHRDKTIADSVCNLLEKHGILCWIAPRDVSPGSDWANSIVTAIGSSRVFVLIFSGSALDSDQVKREVTLAANSRLIIMPIRLENIAPTGPFAYYLSDRHWLNVIDEPMDEHVTTLAHTISRILGKPEAPVLPLATASSLLSPRITESETKSPIPRIQPSPSETVQAKVPALEESPRVLPSPEVGSTIPMRVNRIDGADMVFIPGGEFTMGSNDYDQKPVHKVKLDGYYIYRTPVTVEQYLKFCEATGHEKPTAPDFNPNWSKRDHPIVNVSYNDAVAYCKWAGVKLPTEAQWEKAASWDDVNKVQRKYPWGDVFDSSKLQCSEIKLGDAGSTKPVGSFPSGASPYDVLDMAGNVRQWCSDWYDSDFYSNPLATKRNPENQQGRLRSLPKTDRSFRGGIGSETRLERRGTRSVCPSHYESGPSS